MIILFILLVLLGPRFGNFLWWLMQPTRYALAFPSAIFGILGIIFVPWTTLMYVSVYAGGITGWDWFWIIMGLLADISSYGGSAFGAKKQMTPSPPPPPVQ